MNTAVSVRYLTVIKEHLYRSTVKYLTAWPVGVALVIIL